MGIIAEALGIHPATLLIAEADLARLVAQLARDTALRGQVAFFLTTLDDAESTP